MAHGFFSGNPKTEWLINAAGKDRDMLLLEDFWFKDPGGKLWSAPAGSIVNGASIPEFLWSTVGSPYTDDYRRASIVHDVACDDPSVLRHDADRMFYYACLAGGCSLKQARLLYAGVRLGAWSGQVFPTTLQLREGMMRRADVASPVAEEIFLRSKLSAIAQDFQQLDDDEDDVRALDAVIAQHINI